MRKIGSVPIFLDYDQAELDRQYEQRTFVPDADEIIRRYAEKSDLVRKTLGEPRVERYGPTPPETLDIYGSGKKAFVFVHGGAWKRQSSREQAFPAEAVIAAGAAYVALNFANLPSLTLPEMVAQVCRGLSWVEKHLSRDIALFGHSSGAHLAACSLTRISVARSALLICGVYDLLPVRLSARNEYVRLDEKLEHEYSPIRHAANIRCPVTVGWSEHEGPDFARQSREFAERLQAPTLIGKGLNHFTMVETLADPASALGRAALNMLA